MFCKKGILRNFSKFTGKQLCWSVFLIKLQTWGIIKKRFHQRCFSMKSARFFRTAVLYMIIYVMQYRQKQPPRVVPWERCSENMLQINRRTTMPKCDFNKVALQRIKIDDVTRKNDSRDISWYLDICKGKLLKLVNLTNLFQTLYPRLVNPWINNPSSAIYYILSLAFYLLQPWYKQSF